MLRFLGTYTQQYLEETNGGSDLVISIHANIKAEPELLISIRAASNCCSSLETIFILTSLIHAKQEGIFIVSLTRITCTRENVMDLSKRVDSKTDTWRTRL